MVNWVPDVNRFNMPAPPDWALQKLYNFDAMLVIIPSRKKAQYLLTRRRQHSIGLGDVAMLDNKHVDTNMCYSHGVVPIAPLKFKRGKKTWQVQDVDAFLDELRRRDTWAISGGPQGDWSAVADAVEAHDLQEKKKLDAGIREGFYNRAREAWRALQARTGQRNRRASDYHGVARNPHISKATSG